MVTIQHRYESGNQLPLAEYDAITERLQTLNNLYGRGNITCINFESGEVECQKQYGKETKKFRLEGDTVYFRGHQSNWKKPYRY